MLKLKIPWIFIVYILKFIYDKEKNEYLCPEGHKLIFLGERYDKTKGKYYRYYKGQSCKDCPKKDKCTKSKNGIRYLKRSPYEKERIEMKEKMKTESAKNIYDRRKETVEPTFGNIKENNGMLSFLTRNLKNVKGEFDLACIGHNLQRIKTLRMNKAILPPT